MALLEAHGLTRRFGGLVAVSDLDLEVGAGDIVAMIGPNGAGKTTAFNLIAGVYRPNTGRIVFDGHDITRKRPDQICRLGVARTFQVVRPFGALTVLENVMIGAYARTNSQVIARDKAREALEAMGMLDLSDRVARDLPIAGRKRLEMARALATEPKVLLLDETMAGLRPAETDEVIEMVRALSKRGIAILLVEHVMKVVMSLADRVVVLHHGQKIAEGTPAEIVKNAAVIDAYLGEAVDDAAG